MERTNLVRWLRDLNTQFPFIFLKSQTSPFQLVQVCPTHNMFHADFPCETASSDSASESPENQKDNFTAFCFSRASETASTIWVQCSSSGAPEVTLKIFSLLPSHGHDFRYCFSGGVQVQRGREEKGWLFSH